MNAPVLSRCMAAALAWVSASASADPTAVRPFFEARSKAVEYVGPGRDAPAPTDIKTVKIGWFGPTDRNHPAAGAMWCAATLAVDDANQAGGYEGLAFRLVASWSENPWGTGIKGVTQLAYAERVWALVGAPDGPSAHLVEQVTAKARLPFMNPISTDKTANLVNVPWIFSCAPGDHLQAPILAKAIVSQAGKQGFVLFSYTDHDSRLRTTELLAALQRVQASPKRHVEFRPAASDLAASLKVVREAGPGAVVVIADPEDSARAVAALRQAGITLPIFGGPAMGRTRFVQSAGPDAEGVTFPLLWHPRAAGEQSKRFAKRFRNRFKTEPDYTAAYAYDAMNLLIAAVRRAGLNRVRIRDAIRALSPWSGVTGTIAWDPSGANQARVGLGTIRRGQVCAVDCTE